PNETIDVPFGELLVQFGTGADVFSRVLLVIMEHSRIASVWAALSTMQPLAAQPLLKAINVQILIKHHADILLRHYRVFQIEPDGGGMVHGGKRTTAIWQRLVGVSPQNAQAFWYRLLTSSDGMLAFLSTMGSLDAAHQVFATKSYPRLSLLWDAHKRSATRT